MRIERWIVIAAAAMAASCGGGRDGAHDAATTANAMGEPPHALAQVAAREALGAPRAEQGRPAAQTFVLDSTSLMDWAERAYPEYFPGHKDSQYYAPYVYRFYPETGNYMGVAGDQVRVFIPSLSPDIVAVGTVNGFLCDVFADRCTGAPIFAPAPRPPASTASRDVLWLRTDTSLFEYLTSNQLIYSQTPSYQPVAANGTVTAAFGGTQISLSPARVNAPFLVTDAVDATSTRVLQPGLNKVAGRGPIGDFLPGLDITTPGRGCSAGISSFYLHELQSDMAGKVQKLAVDLSFDCAGANHQLQGAVRFHSDVPSVVQRAFAVAGPDLDTGEGRAIFLDGSRSWSPAAPIFKAKWTQLSGPPLDLSDCSRLTCWTYSPSMPGGGGDAVLRLDVQAEDGAQDSDTMRVKIASNDDRKTLLEIWGAGFVTGAGSQSTAYSFGPASSKLRIKKLLSTGSIYQNQSAERVNFEIRGMTATGTYGDFTFDLMSAKGSPLVPGTYWGQGSGYEAYEFPSIVIANTGAGLSCFQSGRMIIEDIDRDPDDYSQIRSLSAFLRTNCRIGDSSEIEPNYARILINHLALARPTARIAGPSTIAPGGTIELSAAASSGSRPIDTVVWRQISGPDTGRFTLSTDGVVAQIQVGTDTPPGSRLVYAVDVVDGAGEADTAIIVVTVS